MDWYFWLISVSLSLSIGYLGWRIGRREGHGEGYREGYDKAQEEQHLKSQRELHDARRSHPPRADASGNARVSRARFVERNG